MNNKTKSILLLIIGILLAISGVQTSTTNLLLSLIQIIAAVILFIYSSKFSKSEVNEDIINLEDKTKKLCKYCKSEINEDATICPNCRKTQKISVFRITIGVLIGIVLLLFYFANNNDSPVEVRKFICGIGLRDDYPYCYYINTDKLDGILNK